MTYDDLRDACATYERVHGTDAFLEALSFIMTERMGDQGFDLQFDDEALPPLPTTRSSNDNILKS